MEPCASGLGVRGERTEGSVTVMLGRVLAASSYFGLIGALVPLAQPDNRFVVNHARGAIRLHLLRVVLILPVLILPVTDRAHPPTPDDLSIFAGNLSFLALCGLPLPELRSGAPSSWVVAVLVLTWAAQLAGAAVALAGLTTDWHAFFHADWPNRNARPGSPAVVFGGVREKEELSRLRDVRLARRHAADAVASNERRRRGSLEELREEFAEVSAHRAHQTQLLQLGEISERRYKAAAGQLDAWLNDVATQIAILGARRSPVEPDNRQRRELPTDLIVHVPLQTLAISGRNGIPLFTYGGFRLDEALVAGILTSFSSLSEEVFGAQVHKTELAEGQVLSFVHARWTVTMAVFDEEPSPAQVRMLRDLVDEFERINSRELSRSAPDPARLRQVHVPFTFAAE